MIARLSGELVETGSGFAVVVAGGVGYQVFLSEKTLVAMPRIGSLVEVYTRQIVRENEIALFGFSDARERRFFDLLISVSGMGPRTALACLGAVSQENAVSAILENDWKQLTRAPGVGPKLAQRLCVELVDKVREEALLGNLGRGVAAVADDVVEALVSLGLRRNDAERAAAAAREEIGGDDPRQLIPVALQRAGGGNK